MAWQRDSEGDGLFNVEARGFNADGTQRLAQFTANVRSRGQQVDPSIAMDPASGDFAIGWEDDGDEDGEHHIRFRGFNADGTERFPETKADCVEPAQHLNMVIGVDSAGGIHLYWEETPYFVGPKEILGRSFP